ncbi:MAG: NADH-quinone oxidoreductase subunit NuoH [Candidatus Gastranaerophilales bacterium]|nr:NADH-quinone oxidoreductase subunit NuoH [Candidatus Gastranaerophilales bacterium]
MIKALIAKLFSYFSLPHILVGFVWVVFKFAVIAAIMVVVVLMLVLMERRVLAVLTIRKGPNRVGPNGLLQTIADAIKLLFKEDIVPTGADRVLFTLAPVLFFAPVLVVYGLIPFAEGRAGIDSSCSLLLLLAVSSVGILGLVSAGWASNNKYSMLGSMRSVAQGISYELPLVIAALGVVLLSGSMSLNEIVLAQKNILDWYILPSGIGFFIFLTCTLAELNRCPFDLPEAESELVGGYNTEYSGMKFALFFLAEYALLFAYSAVIATLFFGGYTSPFGVYAMGFIPYLKKIVFVEQFFWLMLKTFVIVYLIMWIRATLPRLRADQLMSFSWKFLLPLSFLNLILLALLKYYLG